jgi:hypothetical protein
MPDDIPKLNTGFLQGSGTKNLWLGGTIPYEVVLESGDWRPFLPVGEKQRPALTDVKACVTFSDLSSLEIQGKQQTGIENNWSDRFIAKLSGTTPQGNYLDKVADTVRKFGLVKESDYPAPANFTWNSYYSEVPQEVINKATKVDIAYEAIDGQKATLLYHLKQCPIQIVITNTNPSHAVVLVHIDGNTAYYFDSYSPYLKTTSVSNIYNYALKIVLKGNMNPDIKIYKNGAEYQLVHRAKSQEGFAQQLFDAGCQDLLTVDGKPDFAKIDQIAQIL